MSDHVVVSIAGGVLEVRFNRPEKKNALTREMYEAVSVAFEQADADPAIRVVLLTGSGDTFTSGNDVKDFQGSGSRPRGGSRFLPALSSLQKPLIAAVNGAAIGVGTTMLLHCDLIVAARSARFVMPFTSLGLVPEAASSLLVPRLLGHQRASAMLLLGEPLDAATALDWGLVNRVVPEAELDTAVAALAGQIASKSPLTLAIGKAAFYRQAEMTLAEAYDYASAVMVRNMLARDAAEGIDAFLARRPAIWTGT